MKFYTIHQVPNCLKIALREVWKYLSTEFTRNLIKSEVNHYALWNELEIPANCLKQQHQIMFVVLHQRWYSIIFFNHLIKKIKVIFIFVLNSCSSFITLLHNVLRYIRFLCRLLEVFTESAVLLNSQTWTWHRFYQTDNH